MRAFVKIFTIFVVASSDFTESLEKARLSEDIVPSNYKIQLNFEKDFAETKTFSGNINITFASKNDLNYFPIHGRDITIDYINMQSDNMNISVNHTEDKSNDFWIINCTENNLNKNKNYTMSIDYTGILHETSMEGLYLSVDSDAKYVVSTLFEKFGARRVFPCFDKPALKATFEISVTYPITISALSNTDVEDTSDFKTMHFRKTQKMSTYSLALMVSEFKCTKHVKNQRIELCAKENQTFALGAASAVLDAMTKYMSPYDTPGVISLAAVPNLIGRCKGGWGLIFFREDNLLWDETESSDYNKQEVVTSITYGISHQWFGGLVTPNWWSNIFLSESFATYFEYHISEFIEMYKNWQLQNQFVIEKLQPALLIDSLNTSVPLSCDTSNQGSSFSDISHNKGGSILRMVQYMLGSDNFKKGVVNYVEDNAYDSTTPETLWKSFEDVENINTKIKISGVTFSTLMKNWTEKSGYPLLNVTSDGENVTISQQQFLLVGNATSNVWYVPISYILQDGDLSNTTIQTWLTPQDKSILLEGVLKDKNWIILNNQQIGYYRVNYDKNLLSNISKALENSVDNIDEISRSQLVDDQLNLARAGVRNYSDVLKFIKFLENDTSYYSWYPTFNAFDYLLSRITNNTAKTALENYLKSLMTSLLTSVPINVTKSNDHIYILNQVLAQTWACKLDMKTCVDYALTLFENYRIGELDSVDRNLKSIVYCYGLRNSNNAARDYKFLWKKYQQTKLATEQVTILKSLGCVRDTLLIQTYLTQVLAPDIKTQNAKYVFFSIISNNDNGAYEVLHFLRSNSSELKEHFGQDTTALFYAISIVADVINNQQQIDMLESLSEKCEEPFKSIILEGLDKARMNLDFALNFQSTLEEVFEILSNNACIKNSNLYLVFTLVGYLLMVTRYGIIT